MREGGSKVPGPKKMKHELTKDGEGKAAETIGYLSKPSRPVAR